MKYFAAADPGTVGALIIIDNNKNVIEKWAMPRIGDKHYDLHKFKDMMGKYELEHLVIEDVHAFQKGGATSNFSFGAGKMMIEATAVCLGISYTMVQPKAWQKEMWEGITKVTKLGKINPKTGKPRMSTDTKKTSLVAVKRVFPNEDVRDPNRKTERALAPHQGVVDGLLMAEYCRRKFR